MFSMQLHLLDTDGGVETRAFKTLRGLADVNVSENHV